MDDARLRDWVYWEGARSLLLSYLLYANQTHHHLSVHLRILMVSEGWFEMVELYCRIFVLFFVHIATVA